MLSGLLCGITLLIGGALGQMILQPPERCPFGWFEYRRVCYLLSPTQNATFAKALEACQNLGAGLVSVNDQDENTFLARQMERFGSSSSLWYTSGVRTGLSTYMWVGDGTPMMMNLMPGSWGNTNPLQMQSNILLQQQQQQQQQLLGGQQNRFNNNLSPSQQMNLQQQQQQQSRFANPLLNPNLQSNPNMLNPNQQGGVQPLLGQQIQQQGNMNSGSIVAYQYQAGNPSYTFIRVNPIRFLSYICELPLGENYRVNTTMSRFYGFDNDVIPAELSEFGPKITTQPTNSILFDNSAKGHMDCAATGNPPPTFEWYRSSARSSVIAPVGANRVDPTQHGVDSGHLSIDNPIPLQNVGFYQCRAINTMGVVLSRVMEVKYGTISLFPQVNYEPLYANPGQWVRLQCPQISANSGLSFQWMKNTASNIIPDAPRMFVSHRGDLYIPYVMAMDSGLYFCMATQTTFSDLTNVFGTPVSRISRPVQLNVGQGQIMNTVPRIIPDFIRVHPPIPKVGDTVFLECLAAGTGPINYSWRRLDMGEIPAGRTSFQSYQRVLTITNAQVEDSGRYQCSVYSNATQGYHNMPFTLVVQSIPRFTQPLTNQFPNMDRPFTWRCYAEAFPPVRTYTWYKDGEPLLAAAGIVEVRGNILYFANLDPQIHNGMYQCGAANVHGMGWTSGEMTVVSLPPMMFLGSSLNGTVRLAIGMSATIDCQAMAVPPPRLEWFWNGKDINNLPRELEGRIRLHGNGSLELINAQRGDEGVLLCEANNDSGKATRRISVEVMYDPTWDPNDPSNLGGNGRNRNMNPMNQNPWMAQSGLGDGMGGGSSVKPLISLILMLTSVIVFH